VLTFNMWPSRVPVVKEVQNISISSHCASHLCGSTFFKLSYGHAQTGPIPVSASASEMEAALNNLWSIKPDTVQVTKQEDGQGSHYTITFNSDRVGDQLILLIISFNFSAVLLKRRPPPFESSGKSIKAFSVTKQRSAASEITYNIVVTPLDCAFDFPLMEISFMQLILVHTEHASVLCLSGLSVNISKEDLKYALEGISGMGQVNVEDLGTCRLPSWSVTWLTKPGAQPLMKVCPQGFLVQEVQ
ncbi:hypothetical protein GOODEAATRI_026756, partial [Goodea atripinnis]